MREAARIGFEMSYWWSDLRRKLEYVNDKQQFKGKEYKINVEINFDKDGMNPDSRWFHDEAERVLRDEVRNKVLEIVEFKIDADVVRAIADKLISEYDFNAAIKNVMHEKLEKYLRNI